MTSTIYTAGLAEDVSLNSVTSGVTADNIFEVSFTQPLNFRESRIVLRKGWVKLKSHKISGQATMQLTYNTGGYKDPSMAIRSVEDGDDDDFDENMDTADRTIRTSTTDPKAITFSTEDGMSIEDVLKLAQRTLNIP